MSLYAELSAVYSDKILKLIIVWCADWVRLLHGVYNFGPSATWGLRSKINAKFWTFSRNS